MASYSKFQNNNIKNKNVKNLFKQPKNMLLKKDIQNQWREKLIHWITFYRRNIHRFVEHYFGVKLRLYQKMWLYEISHSNNHMTIASRSNAKSWLIALYGISMCVLYPRSQVVIVAKSMKQAGLIISNKIKRELYVKHPNIQREISDIHDSTSLYDVTFHNGSYMKVVVADENARGERATINIYEEFRLIKKEVIDSVIAPFLKPRELDYLNNPKYKKHVEGTQRIYISSAGYKHEWIYDEFKTYIKETYINQNNKFGFMAFDFKTALRENLKTEEDLEVDRKSFDPITFSIEYENLFFGENQNSFFKLDMFSNTRNIKKSFYPQHLLFDKNKKYINKKNGEIRIMSVDTATSPGIYNDNTAIACFRLIATSEGYRRELVYMETHNGKSPIIQAQRIKQIYNDFLCDYIVLDMFQSGEGIYAQLGIVTYDEERGKEYDALTVMQSDKIKPTLYEDLKSKTLTINAKPVIFPVKADVDFNDKAAFNLKEKLNSGLFCTLVDAREGEDFLTVKNKEFAISKDLSYKAWCLAPYVQISEFISECVNLEYDIVSGKVRLKEAKRTHRKDRYTAVSYGNLFASFLDEKLLKEMDDSQDDWANLVQSSSVGFVEKYY